jgi:threonine dehydrogenase-like Zn-dependent dehydrogenase
MNVARAAGAGLVVGFEPSKPRRGVARDLGFEHVYDPTDDPPATVVERVTGGAGIDVHVETAGAVGQTYPVIGQTLAETANVVHISNAGEPAPVETRQYQGKTAQLYGAEGHTGDRIFPLVLRLMAAGHLDNLPMITSTFDLGEADAAVERAAERVDGKVLVAV